MVFGFRPLASVGFDVVAEEWPSAFFDYLGREENVVVEALFGSRKVNGKPFDAICSSPQYWRCRIVFESPPSRVKAKGTRP